MTTPDPIRAALERLITMASDELTTPGLWAHSRATWNDAIAAGKAALAAAPEGEEPGDWFTVALVAQDMRSRGLAEQLAGDELLKMANNHQTRPAAPPAPLEGEVGELVAKLRRLSPLNPLGTADPTITRAAALLQQLSAAAPAVVPVAVSERLPGAEDCDAEGRCWWFSPLSCYGNEGTWELMRTDGNTTGYTHWLPSTAIPLLAPQGEEGEG